MDGRLSPKESEGRACGGDTKAGEMSHSFAVVGMKMAASLTAPNFSTTSVPLHPNTPTSPAMQSNVKNDAKERSPWREVSTAPHSIDSMGSPLNSIDGSPEKRSGVSMFYVPVSGSRKRRRTVAEAFERLSLGASASSLTGGESEEPRSSLDAPDGPFWKVDEKTEEGANCEEEMISSSEESSPCEAFLALPQRTSASNSNNCPVFDPVDAKIEDIIRRSRIRAMVLSSKEQEQKQQEKSKDGPPFPFGGKPPAEPKKLLLTRDDFDLEDAALSVRSPSSSDRKRDGSGDSTALRNGQHNETESRRGRSFNRAGSEPRRSRSLPRELETVPASSSPASDMDLN